MIYTQVVYITYNMGNRDLPDIYAHALGPAALGLGHIYQANPSCPCYNLYIIIVHTHIQAAQNYIQQTHRHTSRLMLCTCSPFSRLNNTSKRIGCLLYGSITQLKKSKTGINN